MSEALLQSDLPFPVRRGKVRDVYDLGDTLLIVATDRISAFDCVMPNGIPDKGKILTALSLFWFDRLRALDVPTHLIASEVPEYPQSLRPYALRHHACYTCYQYGALCSNPSSGDRDA